MVISCFSRGSSGSEEPSSLDKQAWRLPRNSSALNSRTKEKQFSMKIRAYPRLCSSHNRLCFNCLRLHKHRNHLPSAQPKGLMAKHYSFHQNHSSPQPLPKQRAKKQEKWPIPCKIDAISPEWLVMEIYVLSSLLKTSSSAVLLRIFSSTCTSPWSGFHSKSSSEKPASML